jgi:hypothetical protein
MKRSTRFRMILVLSALAFAPLAAQASHDDVEVRILGTNGKQFRTFPVASESRDVRRLYLEARDQVPYVIRVRNRGNARVALVIAVDGRNIISGERSHLARGERMYVLDPWESAEYEGWRTGRDRVNAFYFTEWRDSYAEAFGDRSARGVIAVAVYREREHAIAQGPWDRATGKAQEQSGQDGKQNGKKGSAEVRSKGAEPGTGFGEEVYSPSVRVAFDAERHPASQVFIKYEWRDSLCRRGVMACGPGNRDRNRFWDESGIFGFAPYPPNRRNY